MLDIWERGKKNCQSIHIEFTTYCKHEKKTKSCQQSCPPFKSEQQSTTCKTSLRQPAKFQFEVCFLLHLPPPEFKWDVWLWSCCQVAESMLVGLCQRTERHLEIGPGQKSSAGSTEPKNHCCEIVCVRACVEVGWSKYEKRTISNTLQHSVLKSGNS